MPTAFQPLKINGVISTKKTVLYNLNEICNACGAFLTFDISQGKWAVVINTTGSSVKSYNDSNIIGNINVSESGVSDLYNSATMEFPHKNLKDQTDFVEVAIPTIDRYPNEIDNALEIQNTLINDPIQAQYIASIELKQKRLNKIISFATDYTSLGLMAGDLITVTNTMYGYTNKIFRVITIEEIDEDVIGLNITAMEYDPNVYSTAGLVFKEKTKKTGILIKQQNTTLRELDDASVAGSIGRMIAANVGLGIVNSLLNKLFGRRQIGTDANGNPIYSSQTKPVNTSAEELDALLGSAKKPALQTITASASNICEGSSVTITVGHNCTSCLFDIPAFNYPYTITGIQSSDINIPLTGNVAVANGSGTLTFTAAADAVAEISETATITIGGLTTTVTIHDPKDFTYSLARSAASITEGQNVTITLTTTGSKLNSSVPYTITGSAVSRVSTATSGNISVSGGTGTLVINTTDDGVYQGPGVAGITITVDPSLVDVCNTVGTRTISVTIVDNDSAPPVVPPDTNCTYVQVPAVWCGVFDGTDNQLKSMTVRDYVNLPVPQAGEASITVPTAVSVTKGNPSTIAVTGTATVAAASVSVGGTQVRIITSFNSVAPLGIITGTTVTLYGY